MFSECKNLSSLILTSFEINKNDALSPIKIAPYNDNENVNILMPIKLRG